MPRKLKRPKARVEGLTPVQRTFLMDGPDALPDDLADEDVWWLLCGGSVSARELWSRYREELLAEWADKFPGTRPNAWWVWEAPEPRQRLGGRGVPLWERLAEPPSYMRGIPATWVNAWYVTNFKLKHADAIHPDDPPAFESEAAYLRRLGLLLPGEERRLTPADYEPAVLRFENEAVEPL